MIHLATAYFSPILHYALMVQSEAYSIEAEEHFVKQSFRSRCEIYGANGKLNLVVPLKKWRNHSNTKEIEVSYEENWQKLHWRSIVSSYRASPYFEFYEEEIEPLVFLKESKLIERNQRIEEELKSILKISTPSSITTEYLPSSTNDWRGILHPKNKKIREEVNFSTYIQVFESKHGFIPNLSILDLLFNLGPDSKKYLQQLSITK